ncbi:aldo/keto reductase [Brachyspira intermedia PWS/A]|uniref:Aldo/keto reductase n=1 Tax=Brachyspira intermedia (strain ATCC 51140 / PWS/A) TaxID=1045858 RepID=G0EM67_BRAIP|nr:aldo/keto reductase [Brachyspira intermedia]AEM21636.1 aldo/keto reductase [Brachyspira intermedia PWS/A]
MDYTLLKSDNRIPNFGIGTWGLGENEDKKEKEIRSIVFALNNGVRLIDTAEMYGNGMAEILIYEALKHTDIKREELFIISKVYPHNAGRGKIFDSLKASLKRLGLDYLDMYLLHWRGRVPLKETVECMEEAKKEGLIRDWGVSNFDIDDMKELESLKYGDKCVLNQVLYHLDSRGVEFDLDPYMKDRNIALMAYSPLGRAGELGRNIFKNSTILQIAEKYNASAAQIVLAFISKVSGYIPIPKSASRKHLSENIESCNIILTDEDVYMINKEFPKPYKKMPLDIV